MPVEILFLSFSASLEMIPPLRSVFSPTLMSKQIKDTEKKDKYRIYGELLTTYAYSIPAGSKEYEALNYYDNTTIKIPLDNTLTPIENANKYFATITAEKTPIMAVSSKVSKERIVLTELTLEVSNIAQLNSVLKAIRKIDSVYEVRRNK